MGRAILIIEDEATLARNLATYLERLGYEARIAGSAEEGLTTIEQWRPEVVLCDHNLPGLSGLDALRRMRATDPDARVVMMTGYGSTELAVDAMKAGAVDFLTKPLVLGEVKLLLERLISQGRLESAVDYFTSRAAQGSGLDEIIGESEPMRALKRSIAALLQSEANLADGEPPAPHANPPRSAGVCYPGRPAIEPPRNPSRSRVGHPCDVARLDEYERKRTRGKTPEPFGGKKRKRNEPIFVVQRHAARRLHYDFRLERGGALASWAVPKGVPMDLM